MRSNVRKMSSPEIDWSALRVTNLIIQSWFKPGRKKHNMIYILPRLLQNVWQIRLKGLKNVISSDSPFVECRVQFPPVPI